MAAEDVYELASALVAENLALRGETSILRRKIDTPLADDAQPWRPSESFVQDAQISALWTEYRLDKIDGELVLEGDQSVLIGALALEDPVPLRDVLIRYPGPNEQEWLLIRSRPIRRGTTDVCFELQVRRAPREAL